MGQILGQISLKTTHHTKQCCSVLHFASPEKYEQMRRFISSFLILLLRLDRGKRLLKRRIWGKTELIRLGH